MAWQPQDPYGGQKPHPHSVRDGAGKLPE
jgi:hypothetical protein